MVAAANPNVSVWGCDFNPAHVERSRALASKAGLTNCTFEEASFADVAGDDRIGPTEADVIVVNGVYSWISPTNQARIVDVVRSRLRPGGLVFVSHAMATGWSSMVPLAEAMHLYAREHQRRSDVAFHESLAEILELAGRGARYFPIGLVEAGTLAQLHNADARYGAHEYLGAHFGPVMFNDVADLMASARCSYVGSIDAADHLTNLWAPQQLIDLIESTDDVTVRQILRDLIVQRQLRRDLYRRGLATPTAVERERWLRDLSVVGLDRTLTDQSEVAVPLGSVTLASEFYAPLVDLLRERALDVDAIQTVHPEISLEDATAALALLVAGGFAIPQVPGWRGAATAAPARRLNAVLIDENRRGADHGCLVAPATGGAIGSEYVEMLTLGALWDGMPSDAETIADYVLAELRHQDRLVREEGVLIDDQARAREIVLGRITNAFERGDGILEKLGIC
jgi:hypothetical protein